MFKKVLKSAALFFAVGVALALVAPPIATLLGPSLLGEAAFAHAMATPVLWTGAFFGAFGAIDTLLRPVFDKAFGDDKPAATPAPVAAKVAEPARAREPELAQEASSKYRQGVEAERLQASAERSAGA